METPFAKVVNDFPFIDFKKNKKILSSASGVGDLYKVAMLLTNCRVCCKGSQGGTGIFGLCAPELSHYLRGGVSNTTTVPHITFM